MEAGSDNDKNQSFQERLQRSLSFSEWQVKELDGLKLTTSPLLSRQEGLVHAFTTRHGGSCPSPFDNFNLGRSVGDEKVKESALQNRQRLCRALKVDHARLHVPGQVHSGHVVKVDGSMKPDLAGVDGLATASKNLPVLLHFADCVPVMIYEPELRLLSIVHAGWRGTAQSIAVMGVERLKELGGDPRRMLAAVGPAIGTCCYPTGLDVVEKLMATVNPSGSPAVDKLARKGLVEERQGQPRPNLKAINALQLLNQGLAQVDVSEFCTSCRPELFYSHRQSGGITGRQGAVGCLV